MAWWARCVPVVAAAASRPAALWPPPLLNLVFADAPALGSDGDLVGQAMGFVCPGRKCMELMRAPTGELRLRVGPAAVSDRYVPSADRLFRSVAALGPRCVAVILTGMGDDGVDGARAIRAAGGTVIAESQETAVVNGMPGAAVRAGVASQVLALPLIGEYLSKLGI